MTFVLLDSLCSFLIKIRIFKQKTVGTKELHGTYTEFMKNNHNRLEKIAMDELIKSNINRE